MPIECPEPKVSLRGCGQGLSGSGPSPLSWPGWTLSRRGPQHWAAAGGLLLPDRSARRQGMRRRIWARPAFESAKDPSRCRVSSIRGNDLRALDVAGRPLPRFKCPLAGPVAQAGPSLVLPLPQTSRREDRLLAQGEAAEFQSPFCGCLAP